MKTGLLWNTCARDLEWFAYSAASFTKFASGFTEAVCLVPHQDAEMFRPVCDRHHIALRSGFEWPGKGFNWHQYQQCRADLWMPGADVIFHIDADTVFAQPVTPQSWMSGDQIVIPFRRFAELDLSWGPGMWKSRVDAALGGDVKLATMTTPPYAHYAGVYGETRRLVELAHPEGFEKYVQSCENSFPQGFAEFETLGAVAQSPLFHNYYQWLDLSAAVNHHTDYVAEGWSHGGLDTVTDRFEGRTAREVFNALGL